MTKCPICGKESPKQFVDVKTVKEHYEQCKTCGAKMIPFKATINLASLSLVVKDSFEIPFDPNIDIMAKTVETKKRKGKMRIVSFRQTQKEGETDV